MARSEADKALSKAKIDLLATPDATFFAHMCLSMHHIWDEECDTAWTNGYQCGYNTNFFMKQSVEKRVGLVLHETLHPVLDHCGARMEQFDNHERANEAGDHVINLMITDRGFRIPDGGCCDKQYRNMSTEQVYALLPDDACPGKGGGIGLDIRMAGAGDGADDDPDGDGQGQSELRAHMDDLIVQAVVAARAAGDKPGSIPGVVERYVDTLLDPEVSWGKVLSAFMTKMTKTGRTYRKPNRRYLPRYILPTRWSRSVCDIACAADLSGSVTDEQASHWVSETASIIKRFRPKKLTFLGFNTKVTQVNELENFNDLKNLKFTGRGGTRIDPVMQWALENKPSVLIVFTDGEYTPPTIDPKVPVIWIIHNVRNQKFSAPFGKYIKYTF